MKNSGNIKNILNFLLRVTFSVALLWYLFTKIDLEQTADILKTADLFYIAAAALIFLAINWIILFRWYIFIKALDLSASFFQAARFFFIGLFGNLFLPSAIGGDIIKIVGLCKNSSQKPRVVASVLLDRLSGFASIVIVSVCSFILGYKYIQEPSLLLPIGLMAAVSIGFGGFLFNERWYSFGCRIFKALPKLQNSLMSLHYDVMLLKDKKSEGYKAIVLSAVSQIILAFIYYLTAKGLRQDIPLIYFLIFVPIICVASSFPSIGGLGVREAGAAYLFTKVGVSAEIAVSLSLINFLFMVLAGLIGGGIYVVTLSSRRIQHYSPDAGVDSIQA